MIISITRIEWKEDYIPFRMRKDLGWYSIPLYTIPVY